MPSYPPFLLEKTSLFISQGRYKSAVIARRYPKRITFRRLAEATVAHIHLHNQISISPMVALSTTFTHKFQGPTFSRIVNNYHQNISYECE